jgi:hypothetical protein
VRIQLQTSSGVVFLRRPDPPITVEVDSLEEADRWEFERLVREARFFELPLCVPAPRGTQARTYQITIEDDDRQHTVSVSDPVTGPALQKLIARLLELDVARRKKRVTAPRALLAHPVPTSRVRTSK